jgi:hypothetical protein
VDREGDSAGSSARPEAERDDGVDVSLIRWMLSLTPSERLAVLQGFIDDIAKLRSGIVTR